MTCWLTDHRYSPKSFSCRTDTNKMSYCSPVSGGGTHLIMATRLVDHSFTTRFYLFCSAVWTLFDKISLTFSFFWFFFFLSQMCPNLFFYMEFDALLVVLTERSLISKNTCHRNTPSFESLRRWPTSRSHIVDCPRRSYAAATFVIINPRTNYGKC